MTEQMSLLRRPGDPPPLTERQQFTLDLVTAAGRDGLYADDAGAAWCHQRGKHDIDERCQWDNTAGRQILTALRRKGLVRSRKNRRWYATRLPPVTPHDDDPWPEGF